MFIVTRNNFLYRYDQWKKYFMNVTTANVFGYARARENSYLWMYHRKSCLIIIIIIIIIIGGAVLSP
jgi:hypothetical protein